jgi:hypothetical protein
MVRAVVVEGDVGERRRKADALRAAGYSVELCGGPELDPCPVMGNLPCPLVDRADVLVYDAWVAGGGDYGHALVAEVRETYPDLPVVLTSVGPGSNWVKTEGPHRVVPLPARPSAEELVGAVGRALSEQGLAV